MSEINYEQWRKPDGSYELPDGIWVSLSEGVYHQDSALGSTSIKQLAKNPLRWQYDRLRPRKEIAQEYLTFGRAWHCRILEGQAAFESRYAKPPRPEDFPEALTTADSIKDFLRIHGKKLTGSKAELIARANEVEGCPAFFDDILADWRLEHPDYEELTDRQLQEIEDSVEIMMRDPVLASVMTAGSLMDGAAELSIFYTDEQGIRRKARFDYALPPAGAREKALIIDLKSFTSWKEGDNEEAAKQKVYLELYDVQGAYYLDAYEAAKELVKAGKVFGCTEESARTLAAFLGAKGIDWVWVFLRRDAGMTPVVLSVDANDQMFKHGRHIVADALERYRFFMSLYGPDELWSDPPKVPLRLNSSSMPNYNRGVLYEQPAHR